MTAGAPASPENTQLCTPALPILPEACYWRHFGGKISPHCLAGGEYGTPLPEVPKATNLQFRGTQAGGVRSMLSTAWWASRTSGVYMIPARRDRASISRDARQRRTVRSMLWMAWWTSTAPGVITTPAGKDRAITSREARRP